MDRLEYVTQIVNTGENEATIDAADGRAQSTEVSSESTCSPESVDPDRAVAARWQREVAAAADPTGPPPVTTGVLLNARRSGDDIELETDSGAFRLSTPALGQEPTHLLKWIGVLVGVDARAIATNWGTVHTTFPDGSTAQANATIDVIVQRLAAFRGMPLPSTEKAALATRADVIRKLSKIRAKHASACGSCRARFEVGASIRWSKLLGVVACSACDPELDSKGPQKSDPPKEAPKNEPPTDTSDRGGPKNADADLAPSIQRVRDFRVPGGYELALDGLYFGAAPRDEMYVPDVQAPLADGRRRQLRKIAPRPLIVDGLAEPLDSAETEVKLVYFDDRYRRCERWISRRTIADARSLLELATYGYPIDSGNAGEVVLYLRRALELNGPTLSKAYLSRRYGCLKVEGEHVWRLSDAIVGARAIEMIQPTANPYTDALRTSGTLEKWVEYVRPLWTRHPILRFSIAVNFASLLLRFLRHRSFVVHFWGPSGVGKTALSKLAASAIGDPDVLCSTLNRTQVSVTEAFAHIDDFVLLYDELQVSTIDRAQLIYAFTGGKGRARAMREGGIRREPTWSCVLRTTGEEPLLGSAGRRDLGGQANRVLDIQIRTGIPKNDSESIYSFLGEGHFGYAGRRFLEALHATVNDTTKLQGLRAKQQRVRADVVQRAGVEHERINHIAVIATAQAMVDEVLFGTVEEEALGRAVTDAALVAQVCAVGNEEQRPLVERAMEFLRSHFVAHRTQYRNVQIIGTDDEPKTSLPIVAFISADSRELWYVPSVINEVLERAGYAANRVWSDMAEHGHIARAGRNLKAQRQHSDRVPRNSFFVMQAWKLHEPTNS